MRSFVLVIVVVCAVALGFGIYLAMLGPEDRASWRQARTRPPAQVRPESLPAGAADGIGPGEKVFYVRFDPRSGQMTSRLRAERYQPQKDGRWLVDRPEAEFFLKGGRVLRLTGKTGFVSFEERIPQPTGGITAPVSRVPRKGHLFGVNLLLFASRDSARPELTATMNNASFDNETFRISTEAFTDEAGRLVPADRVPVTVRGAEYEFDGWGLKLQYNEIDRRLDYLRIAYGNRLLIRHPGNYLGEPPGGSAVPQPESGAFLPADAPAIDALLLSWQATRPLSGFMLAAAEAPTHSTRHRTDVPIAPLLPSDDVQSSEPVYRASFQQDVRIFQADRELASARDMVVDYLGAPASGPDKAGAVEPASAATRPARDRRSSLSAPPDPARPRPRRPEPATRPARAPSSSESAGAATQQPIEIRWSGPLTIVPLAPGTVQRIAPGHSIVKLIGSPDQPVRLVQQSARSSAELRCAILTHWSIDGGALLEEGPGLPVELRDSRGTYIRTRSLVFSQADQTATLAGRSHAILPVTDQPVGAAPAQKPEQLDAAWADRCILYLQGPRLEQMEIQRADLWGDVAIRHPELTLNSQSLQLRFEPPGEASGTEPAQHQSLLLRQMDAAGSVHCVMPGPDTQDCRTLDCDSLKLLTARTPEGQLFARSIVAIGRVHAVDREQDVRAGYLNATLAVPTTQPTTRPAPFGRSQLESLVAHQDVQVDSADGTRTRASQITIDTRSGRQTITLHGEPAVVSHEDLTLSGPILHFVPDLEQLTVTGAGDLQARIQRSEDQPAQPLHITWTKSLRADGRKNLVECFGDVQTRSTDPDGTLNTTRAERVKLLTAAGPATRPALATRPGTRPLAVAAFAGRDIRSIALEDGAQIESVTRDPQGEIIQLFHVQSTSIVYDRETLRLSIPQAGRLLLVDNRAPATQPAAQQAVVDPVGTHGHTAFSWDKSLLYDEAASRISMTGNVVLARMPRSDQRSDLLRMTAQTLTADLEPHTRPSTGPSRFDALASNVRFRHVHAEGPISITSRQLNIEADSLDFDPASQKLIIRGTERNPGRKLDDKGLVEAYFEELVWNTQTAQVISEKLLLRPRRFGPVTEPFPLR